MAFLFRLSAFFTVSCLSSMLFLYAPLSTFTFLSKDTEEIKKYEYETLFIRHTLTMLTNVTQKETLFKTSGFLPKLEKIINEIPLLNTTTVAVLSPRLLALLDVLETKLKNNVHKQYKNSLAKTFMSDTTTFRNVVDLSDYSTFKIKVPQDIFKTDKFDKTKNIFNKITAAHLSILYHALAQTRCIILQLTKLFEWQKSTL